MVDTQKSHSGVEDTGKGPHINSGIQLDLFQADLKKNKAPCYPCFTEEDMYL